MNPESNLRAVAPTSLEQARGLMHQAVQLVSKAARANLEAKADDSHSNLGWDAASQRFLSQPIPRDDRTYVVGLAPATLTLCLVADGELVAEMALDGNTLEQTNIHVSLRSNGHIL